MMWYRNCPECNKKLEYKNKKSFEHSSKNNLTCRSCCQKGHIAWNKGLTKITDERVAINGKNGANTRKQKFDSGELKVWNKGLKSENDERVKDNIEKTRQTLLQKYEHCCRTYGEGP